MKLAWQNIVHDRVRFLVSVAGVSFAVFLMIFQMSLLEGLLRAASQFIDSSGYDVWITARGVPAFELGATLEARTKEIAAGVPGVTEATRVCMGFAIYRKPSGDQQLVGVVGADPNIGASFPAPRTRDSSFAPSPDAVFYNRSERETMQVSALPMNVEINRQRAVMEREISGFGSFLGVPFLFTSYRKAAQFMGYTPEESMYVLLRVAPGFSIADVQRGLKLRL